MRMLAVTILLVLSFCAHAQTDSVMISHEKRDTANLQTYAARYNPRKALLYAAILPGAGQIYTKKYWKLPLVFGGIGVTAYAIDFYQDGYQQFRGELFYNLNNGLSDDNDLNPNTGYTTSQLRTLVDRYRRERDFMIIIMAGIYVLQMIDAHVDAHLKEFDLNPNLHVSVEPTYRSDILLGRTGGVSLKIRF